MSGEWWAQWWAHLICRIFSFRAKAAQNAISDNRAS